MTDWKPIEPPQAPPPPPINVGDAVVAGQAPPPADSPPEVPVEHKGLAARTGGDKVFVLKMGKKHWATTPEALEKAGFEMDDVVEMDRLTLGLIPEGDPLK
jgi:hypothetical protein